MRRHQAHHRQQREERPAERELLDPGLPAAPQSAIAPDAEPDRESILQALARANHVVAQAAADLGLSRQALYRRMERLGIGRGA